MNESRILFLIDKLHNGLLSAEETEELKLLRASDKELDKDLKFEKQLQSDVDDLRKEELRSLMKASTNTQRDSFFLLRWIALLSLMILAAWLIWSSQSADNINQNKPETELQYAAVFNVFEDRISDIYVERSNTTQHKSLADSISTIVSALRLEDLEKSQRFLDPLLKSHHNNDMINLLNANLKYKQGDKITANDIWTSLSISAFPEVRDAVHLFLTTEKATNDKGQLSSKALKSYLEEMPNSTYRLEIRNLIDSN